MDDSDALDDMAGLPRRAAQGDATLRAGADVPAALAEPAVPVPTGWITLLFAANIGMWLAIYAPIQVLLPEQVQSLHDHIVNSNSVPSGMDAVLLSVVMGVGAIGALIANPVVGALSDRTTSPRGRRHPWTIGCALIGAAGLAIVAASPAVWVMAVGWFIAELGLGGMLARSPRHCPTGSPSGPCSWCPGSGTA